MEPLPIYKEDDNQSLQQARNMSAEHCTRHRGSQYASSHKQCNIHSHPSGLSVIADWLCVMLHVMYYVLLRAFWGQADPNRNFPPGLLHVKYEATLEDGFCDKLQIYLQRIRVQVFDRTICAIVGSDFSESCSRDLVNNLRCVQARLWKS